MSQPTIEPHKITRPIQLPAVWLVGLVLIVSTFVSGALLAEESWLKATFAIAAIATVPVILGLVFLLQTKYRPELQDDLHYAEYKRRQEGRFTDFERENVAPLSPSVSSTEEKNPTWVEAEKKRTHRYKSNEGLFLVHAWRPSQTAGQVADIAINLYQHGEGPLTQGKVKFVEYHLGPNFFDYPVIETDPKDNFRLDVSAYASMLCLARVHFTDGRPPLELERYIDI